MNEMRAIAAPSLLQVRRRPSHGPGLVARVVLVGLASLAAVVPAGAGSWRSIGPEGASIQTLAAGGAGVVYAFTGREVLYASLDGAASWSARPLPVQYLDELVVDPARPEILFVVSQQSVIQSKDGGRSWSGPLFEGGAWTVRVAPSAPDVVYASRTFGPAVSGILKSTDGGVTWEDAGLRDGPSQALAVDPADSRIVYAGRADGVFRSVDGGAAWANAGLAGVSRLAIDPRQPSTVYAGASRQIFKSTDRGATWSLAWAGPETIALLRDLTLDPLSGAVYTIFSQVSGTAEDKVFRSTDGGATWLPVFSRFNIQGLAVDGRSPGRLYLGTQAGGVYRSDDRGGSWTAANHGLREAGFAAIAADPNTPGVLFAASNMDPIGALGFSPRALFRSTDGGATWTSPFGNPEASPRVNGVTADPLHPGTWYVPYAGGVLKSQDGGETWISASQGLRSPEFVDAVVSASPKSDKLYALGWDRFPTCGHPDCSLLVYRSGDGGEQWQGVPVPGLDAHTLLVSLTVDATKPSTLYAAGSTVFKSTDGGVRWTKGGGGLGGIPFSLAADPFTHGILYAVVQQTHSQRVLLSRDGGTTWTFAGRGLPDGVTVSQLVPDAAAPGTVYAATSRGVFVTRNRGKLWTAMNDGLGPLPVWTVALDSLRPGIVYAGRADGLFLFAEDAAGH
ncbi:MAG TPA: hypothetical protein VLX28_28790 [Thermoanaerobaculia bacterium]|nr:hypothetical protein [Thermoanaerobaculia bacterium]